MNIPENIQRRLAKLDALEAGGVDNWEWYGESLKEWNAENEKAEITDELIEELCEVICCEIDQPAGSGCGYGITTDGLKEMHKLLMRYVKDYNENND